VEGFRKPGAAKERGALSALITIVSTFALVPATTGAVGVRRRRDGVKPSNIIVGGPVRLVDLSIAQTVDALADKRSPIGTDAYRR
jgi:hypothetical protein